MYAIVPPSAKSPILYGHANPLNEEEKLNPQSFSGNKLLITGGCNGPNNCILHSPFFKLYSLIARK